MGISRRLAGILLGSTAAALAWSAGTASAQDVQLAPVIIEGEQQPADANGDTAAKQDETVTKASRALLQKRMADDFEDVGRRVDAGVNYNTRNKSVNVRGLQDNRVLTTIDGIRLPWLVDPRDSARGGLNSVDFDGLSSLDIARGADSSRYGSGAVGGVVQLRTLDPEDLIEDGRTWGGLVKGAYDSADRSWRTNAAVAAHHNDTWLMVQGGYRAGHETDNFGEVGGYGSTRTEADPKDYDQTNLLVKLHQYVEGGHRFGLTGELFNRKDTEQDFTGTTASYVPDSLIAGEKVNRKRVSASYDFDAPDKDGLIDAAHLIAYWQDEKLNATTDGVRLPDARGSAIPGDPFFYGYPSGIYQRDNWIRQSSYGLTGDAENETVLGGRSHTFRFGGEFYGQRTTQYSWGKDNCPDVDWSTIPDFMGPQTCRFLHSNAADMPEVNSLYFGAFVEDDIKFFDDRLTLTPGVRVDWFDHNPEATPEFVRSLNYNPDYLVSNSDAGISPKLRAAWQATPEFEVFAQWAQGFRAPSATELYQNYGALGRYARIGNPDLKSETSNGFEIGAAYETPDLGISINAFNNYYRDFIDTVVISPPGGDYPLGGVTGYENVARVNIYGAELRGHVNFAGNWRGWGSLAVSQSKARDEDGNRYELSSVAPLRAIVGVGYATETWGADLSTSLVAARKQDTGSDGSGFKAPGYGLVDATVWWQPEKVKGLRVQAGVFNILDQKYWNVTDVPGGVSDTVRDRYTEAGRSFRLAISQKF